LVPRSTDATFGRSLLGIIAGASGVATILIPVDATKGEENRARPTRLAQPAVVRMGRERSARAVEAQGGRPPSRAAAAGGERGHPGRPPSAGGESAALPGAGGSAPERGDGVPGGPVAPRHAARPPAGHRPAGTDRGVCGASLGLQAGVSRTFSSVSAVARRTVG